MSIEMKHAERLQQSIIAMQDDDERPKLQVGPAGCGTILLALPALLFVILALAFSCTALIRCAAMIGG